MKNKLIRLYLLGVKALIFVSPVVDLIIRIYVAKVFWASGITKIESWDTTLALFESEYAVPFLPPELAAYMGTAVELGMPVFLVLGLGTRISALILFVFNIIAVVSYPDLSEVGLRDHIHWGLLLLVPAFHGGGKLTVDYWLCKRLLPPKLPV